jgi:hypothetical protein
MFGSSLGTNDREFNLVLFVLLYAVRVVGVRIEAVHCSIEMVTLFVLLLLVVDVEAACCSSCSCLLLVLKVLVLAAYC